MIKDCQYVVSFSREDGAAYCGKPGYPVCPAHEGAEIDVPEPLAKPQG